MILYCQHDGSNYQVSHYVCLYYCGRSTKIKCHTYDQNYEILKELEVEQKYIDRYGAPEYPEPKARKQRKKKEKERLKKVKLTKKPEAIPAEDVVKPAADSVKPKRKRRTKAEMEDEKVVIEVVAKPKRKRRTKKEMEEANKVQKGKKKDGVQKKKRTPAARKV